MVFLVITVFLSTAFSVLGPEFYVGGFIELSLLSRPYSDFTIYVEEFEFSIGNLDDVNKVLSRTSIPNIFLNCLTWNWD